MFRLFGDRTFIFMYCLIYLSEMDSVSSAMDTGLVANNYYVNSESGVGKEDFLKDVQTDATDWWRSNQSADLLSLKKSSTGSIGLDITNQLRYTGDEKGTTDDNSGPDDTALDTNDYRHHPGYLQMSIDWTRVDQSENGWEGEMIGEYCSWMRHVPTEEGREIPGFILRQAHILLSPGEQFLKTEVGGLDDHMAFMNCHYDGSNAKESKLRNFREVANIYQRMQKVKGGFKNYTLVPTNKICRNRQLTAHGAEQLIRVGLLLNQQYFGNQITSKLRLDPDLMSTQSVLSPSSFQSLIAFLHGFLPEKLFSKVVVKKSSNNFCASDGNDIIDCHCEKTDLLVSQLTRAVTHGKYMFKDGHNFSEDLETLLGYTVNGKLSATELLNTVMPARCNNISFCYHSEEETCPKISESHITTILERARSYLHDLLIEPSFKSFSDLYSYPFMKQLHAKFSDSRMARSARVHLYSTDDAFQIFLQSHLGLPIYRVPSPASRMVFELHDKRDDVTNSIEHYIKVILNGRDVTGLIDACKSGLQKGLCQLKDFFESSNYIDFSQFCLVP